MKTLKFGGTSLANAEKFLHVANIIESSSKTEQVAIVLSAPEKITNLLVSAIDKKNNKKNMQFFIMTIKNNFLNLIKNIYNIETNFLYKIIINTVKNEFKTLQNLFQGIYLLQQCPDNIRAKIICLGESLSIIIMNAILLSRNYETTVINPTKKLLTLGDDYLNATVDIKTSKSRISAMKIPKHHIILMAGFTAGNTKGELVALGRNGSDYSSAILSVCLKSNVCEIWTDVNGIYTCDPKLVSNAKLLKSLSYQEAMELSYFGAKVLHPRTIYPIQQFNIPCIIKNTNNPEFIGTKISQENIDNLYSVKGITHLNNITMFSISCLNINNMTEITSRIFSSILSIKVWIILITQSSSQNTISFCVLNYEENKINNTLKNEFKLELKNKLLKPIKITKQLSIISIIYSKVQIKTNVFEKIFSVLKHVNINIVAISQGSSKRSISIVIDHKNLILGIKSIHKKIFTNYSYIEIFLIGIGGVGKTLLTQFHKQEKYLKAKNINLKVCGIANSKNCLIDLNGINLNTWTKKLNLSQKPFNFNQLLEISKLFYLENPVIIDCTSDQDIANQYISFLNNGFHVVTPNKKANTSDLNYYQKLRSVMLTSQKKFFYETNVGAGLPVIENLKNLLKTGDQLIHFKGILSGSLSFIFGKLEENVSLSEATKQAQLLGLTEPHPKDDLSGIDVARKLLILAREIGYELELKDIQIESLLPNDLFEITNKTEFMTKLKEFDKEFFHRVKKATIIGERLKFIGVIDKNGKCKVKIDSVNCYDPLYNVKNGENVLAFYSKYYQPIPLVLRGYGAGNNVTASGVFSDVLKILS